MSSYKAQLNRMFEGGSLTGTLLFTGEDKLLKAQVALEITKTLFGPDHIQKIEAGHHPDLHRLQVESKGGMHSMAALRSLIEETALPPYEALHKVFIIHDAERMLPTASNALLKTLEEPPPNTLFLLMSPSPRQLLPTILSRCRVIHFDPRCLPPLNLELIEILSEKRDYPSLIKALDKLENSLKEDLEEESSSQYIQRVEAILTQIFFWYRDRHLLALKGAQEFLFHKEHLAALEKAQPLYLPPLETLFFQLTRGHLASQRHIRLRHILELLF